MRAALPAETVPLSQALGRAAAEPVKSPEDLPAFDNSSMDGYAVVAADTRGATPGTPVALAYAGGSVAGDRPFHPRAAKGAWQIMTGAALPRGYDAIVKVEDTAHEQGEVRVLAEAGAGDFIRRAGGDIKKGEVLVRAGEVLDARSLLVLAALGIAKVKVRRRPRVAVLATGGELVHHSKKPRPGQVRNATGPYLAAALASFGAEASEHGAAGDSARDFERRLKKLLAGRPEAVVTTGAVSMGELDYVPEAVVRLGAKVLFHKVAIRPGRPLLFARFPNGTLFFGLPGNPASTVAGLRFFVVPALRRLLGQSDEAFHLLPLAGSVEKPEGLRCFFKAKTEWGVEGPMLKVLPGQASFQVKPFLSAGAWAVLPEPGERLDAGTLVEAAPFFGQELSFQS